MAHSDIVTTTYRRGARHMRWLAAYMDAVELHQDACEGSDIDAITRTGSDVLEARERLNKSFDRLLEAALISNETKEQ